MFRVPCSVFRVPVSSSPVYSWQPNRPTIHYPESVKLDSNSRQSLVIILVTGTHWLGFSKIALVTLLCRLGSDGQSLLAQLQSLGSGVYPLGSSRLAIVATLECAHPMIGSLRGFSPFQRRSLQTRPLFFISPRANSPVLDHILASCVRQVYNVVRGIS